MKKKISVFLVMMLAAGLFAACGNKEVESEVEATEDTVPEEVVEEPEEEPKELVYPWGLTKAPMNAKDAYPYKSVCYRDRSIETTGCVYIYDYTIKDCDDPGYVDKTVYARLVFNGPENYNYGTSYSTLYGDNINDVVDAGEEWISEMNGEQVTLYELEEGFIRGEWLNSSVYIADYVLSVRVPRGFDDLFLAFYNSANYDGHVDEEGNLLEGTSLADLVDEDTQWFVMGSIEDNESWYFNEDTSFTPSYYGGFYETQRSDIDLSGVLGPEYVRMEAPEVVVTDEGKAEPGNAPVEEESEGNSGAYNPNLDLQTDGEVYDDEEDFDGSTVILLDDWSVDEISRKNPGQIKFEARVLNWFEGDHIVVNAYTESSGRNYAHLDYELMNDSNGFTFDFTGETIVGDTLYFDFLVVAPDGFEMAMSQVEIPVK